MGAVEMGEVLATCTDVGGELPALALADVA
jgi:hypothetical protein